jgi:TetR/AcrR family tetracycline transcriptional repressor
MSRRDEVVTTALALLDDVGLDAITIRKLAERLGVQPGALYRHFDSKRELLDAMVERIVVGNGPPAELTDERTGDWTDQVRAIAGATRAVMLSHRDGARLLATFVKPSETAVVMWQRFIGLFVAQGLDPVAAAVAVDTIFSYVNGFTMEEQARPGLEKDTSFQAGLELIIAGVRASLPR